MEKTQKDDTKDIIRDIASNPENAYTYISTIHKALELCQEVLYDLTWEKGGRLEPWQEEYVVTLNKIVSDILTRR